MVESHWSQLSRSGPAWPASTLLWLLCQIHHCHKFTSDLWHLRVLGRGSKEKRRCNIWGGADYYQKLRGRLEKQWHSCSNKKSTLELNWGFRNQDKTKARWRQRQLITHHKSRKSGELGSVHCYIRDFMIFGRYLNWFLRCQQYLGSNGHSKV